MLRALILIALSAPVADAASAATLHARVLAVGSKVPSAVIVGRAECDRRTWLLTETPELVEIASDFVGVHHVGGLLINDRPWGLACLPSRALWTLADPRALVRLGPDGRALERVSLLQPRVALFATGNALLFQQLPTVPGAPVLATGPPTQPLETRSWPGPMGRRDASREVELTRSLVNCGLGRGGVVPCWFADEPRIILSDGVHVRVMAVSFPSSVDARYPVWDVALAEQELAWVLLTQFDPATGRRAGGRLSRVNEHGLERDHVDLHPAARLILSAGPTRCLLLNVDGSFTEVTAP